MPTRALSSLLCGLGCVLVAACGGGGGDPIVVVDASIDAPIDAAIDAALPACSAPRMMCGAECVDTSSNEQACGDCTTTCTGGQVCSNSACGCPTVTIPAAPSFLQQMVSSTLLPGATIGLGGYFGATIDALVVGRVTADTTVDVPVTLDGTNLGTPPFVAFGYDLDINTQTPAAAFYATAGTLTFTKICLADAATGQTAGFTAVLRDATFAGVEGLMNPVLTPGGCTFQAAGPITMTFGNVTCPAAGQ
ncbi:MAG: hypothetical protein R3B06_20810 [Kofleriaceae bacterium]